MCWSVGLIDPSHFIFLKPPREQIRPSGNNEQKLFGFAFRDANTFCRVLCCNHTYSLIQTSRSPNPLRTPLTAFSVNLTHVLLNQLPCYIAHALPPRRHLRPTSPFFTLTVTPSPPEGARALVFRVDAVKRLPLCILVGRSPDAACPKYR